MESPGMGLVDPVNPVKFFLLQSSGKKHNCLKSNYLQRKKLLLVYCV